MAIKFNVLKEDKFDVRVEYEIYAQFDEAHGGRTIQKYQDYETVMDNMNFYVKENPDKLGFVISKVEQEILEEIIVFAHIFVNNTLAIEEEICRYEVVK